jgi:hypothetical protein
MTGTQFLCNYCGEIIDTYEEHDKMMQHITEHEEGCRKIYQPTEQNEEKKDDEIFKKHFPDKLPLEELKSFLEYTIKNDDDCIDFLHNSRHKKDEEWYEKWATNKVRSYLGASLYSPVCKKLGDKAGIEITGNEFDKLFIQVVLDIVNGIW